MTLLRTLILLLAVALSASPALAKEEFLAPVILQNAATATGDGTTLSVQGYNAVVIKLEIGSATVTWEAGGATSDWVAVKCSLVATNGNASTTSASGLYICNTAGMTAFRARISAYTSGSVTVTAQRTTAYAAASSGFLFDSSGNLIVSLGTLLSGEDQTNNLLMTSGGVVRTTTVASAITTNTTSAAATVPIGSKTFAAVLTGTGAITQTLKVYGSVDNTYTAAVDPLLCTITLSGTTAVGDACPVITANFAYYFIVSSSTSGTSASGVIYAMY